MSQLDGHTDLATLLTAASEGDQEAWNVITDRFTSLLWSVARSYRLGSDDAEDVVQNTWLRLLENLPRSTTRRPYQDGSRRPHDERRWESCAAVAGPC